MKNISRDMQISLAQENDRLNELYIQNVRDKVAELYHLTEEVSMLRKGMKVFYDAIVTQHPNLAERKEITEMLEWFDSIEELKAKLRAELGFLEEKL